jgi:hypothetical protein
LSNPVIVHPSCVQIAVSTVKASWLVRAIRKAPTEVWARPAPPMGASAGALSNITEPTRPETLALTEGRSVVASPDGDVGLSPPQDESHGAATTRVAASHAFAQNSRRVRIRIASFMINSSRAPSTTCVPG